MVNRSEDVVAARLVERVDGVQVRALSLSSNPILIGRSEQANWVIESPMVSRLHASLWVDRKGVWVKDLNSTNGTFLNEERIQRVESVDVNAILRIGSTTLQLEPVEAVAWLVLLGRDEPMPLPPGTFRIGSDDDADIRLIDCPEATLTVSAQGEVHLSSGILNSSLCLDQSFHLGANVLTLRRAFDDSPVTITDVVSPDRLGLMYRSVIQLHGDAIFTDLHSNRVAVVSASNRVTLLYVLAQRLLESRKANLPPQDQGWCTNDEVGTQIWGRQWREFSTNRLNVLLHRTRKKLSEAGFDADCLQKRYGRLRLWVAEVELKTDR